MNDDSEMRIEVNPSDPCPENALEYEVDATIPDVRSYFRMANNPDALQGEIRTLVVRHRTIEAFVARFGTPAAASTYFESFIGKLQAALEAISAPRPILLAAVGCLVETDAPWVEVRQRAVDGITPLLEHAKQALAETRHYLPTGGRPGSNRPFDILATEVHDLLTGAGVRLDSAPEITSKILQTCDVVGTSTKTESGVRHAKRRIKQHAANSPEKR